jgi:RNA polymerase sigma-70 factor, ECF subfamily
MIRGRQQKINWNHLTRYCEDTLKVQTSNLEDQVLMMNRLEDRSDAELLELSLAGSESAFLLLYARLKRPVFRYAFYMTNSKAAAEEVTQEVFISLLKNGNRYKPAQGDVPGFVFGIARNFVRRVQRREHVYQGLPSDEALEKLSGSQAGAEGLSAQVIRNQGVERIRTAIASLPDHYRQVVVLCDLCELTYVEAAGRLECALGTIRSRLNRAHALLAQKLKQSKKRQPELPATGTEECLI